MPLETEIEIFVQTGKFTQANYERIACQNRSEAVLIGSQRVRQNEGVLAIVFGTRREVTIAESIELLWINGEDAEVSRQKFFDQGAVWNLDGD